MKSKATLSLIEQLIMVLVFAVAAAVCLRVFFYADALSKETAARDMACIKAQNAAEMLKYTRGDYDEAAQILGGNWTGLNIIQTFDENWNLTESAPKYTLCVYPENSDSPYLSAATISVESDEELFSLQVCWQEDSP